MASMKVGAMPKQKILEWLTEAGVSRPRLSRRPHDGRAIEARSIVPSRAHGGRFRCGVRSARSPGSCASTSPAKCRTPQISTCGAAPEPQRALQRLLDRRPHGVGAQAGRARPRPGPPASAAAPSKPVVKTVRPAVLRRRREEAARVLVGQHADDQGQRPRRRAPTRGQRPRPAPGRRADCGRRRATGRRPPPAPRSPGAGRSAAGSARARRAGAAPSAIAASGRSRASAAATARPALSNWCAPNRPGAGRSSSRSGICTTRPPRSSQASKSRPITVSGRHAAVGLALDHRQRLLRLAGDDDRRAPALDDARPSPQAILARARGPGSPGGRSRPA